MSAPAMPVEEVTIRWSTTEQFEMRLPRAELLEMLADNDELPDELDELDDQALSDLFDADDFADDETNESGTFIATIERTIDEFQVRRTLPAEFTQIQPGHTVRIRHEIHLPDTDPTTRVERLEWVGAVRTVDGDGLSVLDSVGCRYFPWVAGHDRSQTIELVADDTPASRTTFSGTPASEIWM
ncbi:hypothetical protein [Nocardia sp. NPDC004722]